MSSIRTQKYADTAEESADFIEFLGLAGLGQAEASALTWGHVNFERGQLLTFRQKTRSGFAVPIFPQLRPLLEKRRAQAGNPSPDTRVFSVIDAKKSLSGACQRLNLPSYSSRSLRRCFIVSAIEKGVDIKVIAQWQGHVDGGKLILDTYSHVRPAHSERMALLMTTDEPGRGMNKRNSGVKLMKPGKGDAKQLGKAIDRNLLLAKFGPIADTKEFQTVLNFEATRLALAHPAIVEVTGQQDDTPMLLDAMKPFLTALKQRDAGFFFAVARVLEYLNCPNDPAPEWEKVIAYIRDKRQYDQDALITIAEVKKATGVSKKRVAEMAVAIGEELESAKRGPKPKVT